MHRPCGPGPAAGVETEPAGAWKPGGSQPEEVPMPPTFGPAKLCLPSPHRWTCSSAAWCRDWRPLRLGAAGWAGQPRVPQSLVQRPVLCVWTTSATSRLVPWAQANYWLTCDDQTPTPERPPTLLLPPPAPQKAEWSGSGDGRPQWFQFSSSGEDTRLGTPTLRSATVA